MLSCFICPAKIVVYRPADSRQSNLQPPQRVTGPGKLDVEILERTLEEITRRHETLRTRFVAVGGEPQQVIEEQVKVHMQVLDLTGEPEMRNEKQKLCGWPGKRRKRPSISARHRCSGESCCGWVHSTMCFYLPCTILFLMPGPQGY